MSKKPQKKNNTKLRDTFAQVLDEKIAKAGFSIAELAEISDISKSQLYDYKKATKAATTDALDALAGALKCDAVDFLKPGAAAKRSAKPTAKPVKSSKASARPSKSSAAKKSTKPAAKQPKPKGKKHQAKATVTIPLSRSAAPMGSSSDAEPAEARTITDLDTPAGMSAANAKADEVHDIGNLTD